MRFHAAGLFRRLSDVNKVVEAGYFMRVIVSSITGTDLIIASTYMFNPHFPLILRLNLYL